ncbi:Fic family protein [Paenibacillus silvae]|uniref:Fic family protein n=1 Tax=Paenibacillus silvae TaxID=1325358 RepID=UPI002004A92C|nr:Fic family protein [Paenibacillus silvae]MCK6076000.1 Fic family protein [Paenibacillus silvae]MCK6150389.1 Fic family protein [Paenibacillus silvae]MCK6268687.1 Fic family protein [Paenibacillus silvae]
MRHIYKIYHEKSNSELKEVYQQRFNYDSTVQLGLHIKPMSQPNKYELYYVPTNQLLNLINDIHFISNEFQKTFEKIPQVAQNQFINECLVEELFNTNDLEGIRSSREEIARSTREIQLKVNTKKRFESMIKSYMGLLSNEIKFPRTPEDIRKIYDNITNGEIDQKELPDGDIFRKETTFVQKKSGSGKIIHQGITPEKDVITAIEQLMNFMNNQKEIPLIIRVAIGHYFYGYIHPFYDGNGRTSRFISSLYLSDVLGEICTLSLSRGCNTYRNKYLEAFEITNSIRSCGEMNYFIECFLEIILSTLNQMHGELKEKNQLLNLANDKLLEEPLLKEKDLLFRNTMFVLAQNLFFDSGNGLTIKDLAEISGKSELTMRKITSKLLELALIEKRGERPAYYHIRSKYFEG